MKRTALRIWNKIWSGGGGRKSRFHDATGHWALSSPSDFRDCLYAFVTTVLRVCVGERLRIPWLTFSSMRFLRSHLCEDSKVFEYGCGMSTLWYHAHCGEVHAVEDNRAWAERIKAELPDADVAFASGAEYVLRISVFPKGYFDVIVIDGSHRLECLALAPLYLRDNGVLVIDNTDWSDLDAAVQQMDQFQVCRFTGWPPGVFFATQTTIAVRMPGA